MFKFNYILVVIYSILVVILVMIGKLSFGHGLGDLYYIIELVIFLCFIILLNSIKHKINYSFFKYFILLLSVIIILYFSLKLTIYRGVEKPWDGNVFIRWHIN